MKKYMLFFLIIFVLAGCSESKNSMNQPVKQKKRSVSFRHKLFQKEFEPELEKMLKVKDEIVLKSDPADSSKMFIYNKHIGAIEDSVFMMKLKYLKSKGVDILSLPIKQGDTEQGEQKQQEFYSEKKNYKIQLPIDDINKILKSLIDKYGFQVQSSDDYSVYFKGQKCDLKLQQNYFDLEMYLINPKNNNAYLCDTLIRYFKFKFEGDEKTQNSDKIVLQQEQIDDLKEYNHLLEEFFPFVLKGDFTWDNDYRLYIKEESKLLKKIWNLDVTNSIYQKFQKNNFSWKTDLTIQRFSKEFDCLLKLKLNQNNELFHNSKKINTRELNSLLQSKKGEKCIILYYWDKLPMNERSRDKDKFAIEIAKTIMSTTIPIKLLREDYQ